MSILSSRTWLALVLSSVISLASCGGGPSSNADFSLSANPSSAALTAGSPTTASLSVTATAAGGFKTPVSVTLSGLPAGVTASPATLTVTPGTAQSVTLAAGASAAVGTATLTLTGAAGKLSHTATVALTVAAAPPPPADFALTISPASQSITAGTAGPPLTVTAAALNGFTGTVAVALTGLPAGVTAAPAALTLTPGASQTLILTVAPAVAAGAATITLTGTSGSLTHTASLALTVAAAPVTPPAIADVTTYHYRNSRDGLDANETTLTPANVNATTFGLRGVYLVDGKVDAQPLFVAGLNLPAANNARAADVLYVATEHGTVYALDAATGAQVWKTSVLGAGETTSDARGCNQIVPEIGITATPVIDRGRGANGAIFVVGMSKDAGGGYHQRLHGLDLMTGAELAGSPTEITATYPGTGAGSQNGQVPFAPAQYAERAGLLLLNGSIYTAWTSHCDINPYTGWVIGFSEATLARTSVLNLTPNGSEGSVWMSGYGLAADSGGDIYLLDANGTLDSGFTASGFPARADYGNALLKLSTEGGLKVADFFEPFNTAAESAADADLGSGGAMLLPDVTDAHGAVRHLVVGAGKDGNLYVGDRDNLGKFNAADNSNLYQEIPGALPRGAWSGPAFFNNTVFYGGVGDALKAYTVTDARLSSTPTSQSTTAFGYPGATPSVSANGTQDGIVWALESGTGAPAVLHAYDAADLGHELYNSAQAANGRDGFGNGNKFLTPMVANGNVFVGTPNGVAVFGLFQP